VSLRSGAVFRGGSDPSLGVWRRAHVRAVWSPRRSGCSTKPRAL
jgi:hypothetical protein